MCTATSNIISALRPIFCTSCVNSVIAFSTSPFKDSKSKGLDFANTPSEIFPEPPLAIASFADSVLGRQALVLGFVGELLGPHDMALGVAGPFCFFIVATLHPARPRDHLGFHDKVCCCATIYIGGTIGDTYLHDGHS